MCTMLSHVRVPVTINLKSFSVIQRTIRHALILVTGMERWIKVKLRPNLLLLIVPLDRVITLSVAYVQQSHVGLTVAHNNFTVNYQDVILISYACLTEVGQSVPAVEKTMSFLLMRSVACLMTNALRRTLPSIYSCLFSSGHSSFLLSSSLLSLIFVLVQVNCTPSYSSLVSCSSLFMARSLLMASIQSNW